MIRFAVIGAGYRGSYYLRVAKQNPDKFEIIGILARSIEKAKILEDKWGVPAFTDENKILALKPDFVVVSVTKADIADVSIHWKEMGIPVLCETPVSLDPEKLEYIYETRYMGAPLMVAEQYGYYPTYHRIIDLCNSGKLGDILCANLSIAHDYHGMHVMRQILGVSPAVPFSIVQKRYDLPITKTHDRYLAYHDGEIIVKTRRMATVEFADGKIGSYDFDSEQYHSSIRHNSIHITGTRGEIINEKCWYLDEQNNMKQVLLCENLQKAQEGPEEDEYAVMQLMEMAGRVSRAYYFAETNTLEEETWQTLINDVFEAWENNLTEALQDAYMATHLYTEQSMIKSEFMNWMEE